MSCKCQDAGQSQPIRTLELSCRTLSDSPDASDSPDSRGCVRPDTLKNNNNINMLSFYKSDCPVRTVCPPNNHGASVDKATAPDCQGSACHEGATAQFGDHTAWAGQTMCRNCATKAFRQIAAETREPSVAKFMARARRLWPGAKIVSDAIR